MHEQLGGDGYSISGPQKSTDRMMDAWLRRAGLAALYLRPPRPAQGPANCKRLAYEIMLSSQIRTSILCEIGIFADLIRSADGGFGDRHRPRGRVRAGVGRLPSCIREMFMVVARRVLS